MMDGIDVSRWQGYINWPIVARSTQFAIIKIGGSDQGFYADGQAMRNVLEARANNVPIGFYVYLGGAASVQDEVTHIKNLISNIAGLKAGEFIALDWEENHPDEVGYVYGIAKGLIDAGFNPPLIYMSLSYVKRNDWRRLVALNCGLWVAAWGNNDAEAQTHETPISDEWPMWAFWQYSSTGTVPGIAGRVDKNKFNGTLEQFKKYGAKQNVTMPSPTKTSQVVMQAGQTSDYIVKKDENLSAIAARYGKRWQELWELNRDRVSNPDKIFTGQAIRVWATESAPQVVKPVDGRRYHTVRNGENLSVIAAKYGISNWPILYEANRAVIGPNPDLIKEGQVLVIP